jgi:hypothetical protein
MDRAEYDRTRVLPERVRATRNGKRSIDAFIKSIRERTAAEHPEWLGKYDNELSSRLMILYFYFTKYIANRWDVRGMSVFAACEDAKGEGYYTDNLLDGNKTVMRERFMHKAYIRIVTTRRGRFLLKLFAIF